MPVMEAMRMRLIGQHLNDVTVRDSTATARCHHARQLGFQRLKPDDAAAHGSEV